MCCLATLLETHSEAVCQTELCSVSGATYSVVKSFLKLTKVDVAPDDFFT